MLKTPNANSIHIAIFGARNSGKSSLINAITDQEIALVSNEPGTTTDPVYKAMEIKGLGACVLIDTAGYDDIGYLGEKRVAATRKILNKADLAILVVGKAENAEFDKLWLKELDSYKIPNIIAYNEQNKENINYEKLLKKEVVKINTLNRYGIDNLLEKLILLSNNHSKEKNIAEKLVKENDVVMLVMPQDESAPKGRLILPQVETIRSLLDNKCSVICCEPDKMSETLNILKSSPDLIITDSQVFAEVYKMKPEKSRLTSFSVLFADYKGDIDEFIKGANAMDLLNNKSRVLIAEACTHVPQSEDIGRVKIPFMLRQRYGADMVIDIVSGNEFPDNLEKYDLIIHCGACMFNRRHVLNRIERAKEQNVPITNYGIAIAKLKNILDKIDY